MKSAYLLLLLMLLPVLLCSCAAPAVPGTESGSSEDVAVSDSSDVTSVSSSSNEGPIWAQPDDSYDPPVVTPAEKVATLSKYYTGQ